MLLKEILTKPILNMKQSPRAIGDLWTTKQHSVVGVGAQTVAYLHKKFPNKIIKTIQISGNNDPSYQFLRICLKHQNNPWFPKIYAVKQYNSRSESDINRTRQYDNLNIAFDDQEQTPPSIQNHILIVVTEKLTPISENQYSPTDIGNIFGVDISKFLQDPIFKKSRAPSSFIVGKLFETPEQRKLVAQKSNDANFKQAMRLLEPLFTNYDEDMGFRNIMLRPPNQWVFIDPVQNF